MPRLQSAGQLGGDNRSRARRAGDQEQAVQRLDAIREPAQPGAGCRVGSPRAVVGDLDGDAVVGAPQAQRCGRRVRVLADVRECLAGDEVQRKLDRRGTASGPSQDTAVGTVDRVASDSSADGSPRSSTAGCIPRASSRSSASDCASWSLAVVTSASAADGSRRMRPWMSCSCRASATSRCCAPSCRLRSSRRRSASPAATMRCRDACRSASRACDSGCRCSFSSAIVAAAHTASTSSGSSSSDAS